MPSNFPGFYYDPEKKRYFPLKGRIPGSSRAGNRKNSGLLSPSKSVQAMNFLRKTPLKSCRLLHDRELNSDLIVLSQRKCKFKEEFYKLLATKPLVWKYRETNKICDGAMGQVHTMLETQSGKCEVDFLVTSSMNGLLSLFEVGEVQKCHGIHGRHIADYVWPPIGRDKTDCSVAPLHISRPTEDSLKLGSNITCIIGSRPCCTYDFSFQQALVTTLGSDASHGTVYLVDLTQPLDLQSHTSLRQLVREITSFRCTLWTADCNSNMTWAVAGTSLGAVQVNLETGISSWVCKTESDVLAQKLDSTGNVVLCGLRNGTIVSIDIREKQDRLSTKLIRHRVPYPSLRSIVQKHAKHWFVVQGNILSSQTFYLPSAICSLVSIPMYDQYILASSMDGSVRLYDHRMTARFVQSYEGHVNSHTRSHLAVDPSGRFFMAGGEDCKLRIWSIKSAELLFEERLGNSVMQNVCWSSAECFATGQHGGESPKNCLAGWLSSEEGLFYMSL